MSSRGIRVARSRSYEEIERIAGHVRAVIGIAPDQPVPGLPLFERIDKLTVRCGAERIPLTEAVEELPLGVEARARFQDGRVIIALSAETYADLERHDTGRARFSLAHEVGHGVLHIGDMMRLSFIPHHQAVMERSQRPTHRPFEDSEWQANAFAAAFLSPAEGLETLTLDERLTPNEVSARFGVSNQAAEIRIGVFRPRMAQLAAASKEGRMHKL